ncbi:TetR family transcriptional regulator [Plantactinospora endophytica]|uniref:TetR family transcriptional regulator n=1 Tax=Plantactinospora endophytica TaxID=673535 RepID=A0ABQ4E9K7_9ACTN|nr:TetR family transcriptional regulator [Plantactinospora endophytica]
MRPPRSPGRSGPPLHRERIVAAAVELLDQDGVGGLTMRRLAERLDAGSTTLYWHVTNKDDVLDLALDQIFGEVQLPEQTPDGNWQSEVEALVLGWLAAMLRHPWSAALLGRPLLGPNVLTRTEFLQSALRRAGLVEPDLTAGTHALANYVIGTAVTLSTWQRLDDPEFRQAAQRHLTTQRDRYPTLVASGHLDDRDWADTFRRGLKYLMAGLAARM